MKHRRGFNPLERMVAHRKAMVRNMITSLFRYERIRTTRAKALEVRRFAEKLITRGKIDSVHNRRIASSRLYDEAVVAKLFTDIGPRMKEREGGYTRILKLGERNRDAAEVVLLELVDYKLDTKDHSNKKAKKEEKKTVVKKEKAYAKTAAAKADHAEKKGHKKV
jgi:large subunit ribosomal protein L17